MNYKFLMTIIAVIAIAQLTFGQKKEKLKKVTIDDLKMEYYTPDSTAEAVYLHDEAMTYFDAGTGDGFRFQTKRIFRIKILKEEGLRFADFSIPVYEYNSVTEEVGTIKAFTYNLVNGKIEKTKLERSSKFREEVSKNKSLIKITLPEVKVGSVIEISYNLTSKFLFNLQEWYIQRDIPVKYNFFTVSIPQYFNYKMTPTGYATYQRFHNISPNTYNFKYETTRKGTVIQTQEIAELKSNDNVYTFIGVDVPAFEVQSYMPCPEDYITKVEFELKSEDYMEIGGSFYDHTSNWSAIAKKFRLSSDFGERFMITPFLNDIAKDIQAISTNKMEVIQNAYWKIKDNVKWNSRKGAYIRSPFRKIWNEKSGSATEINMLYLALLKKLDIEAYPLMLSTRSNGKLFEHRVNASKLNYSIVYVPEGESYYLFDLTDRNCNIDMLPGRCLNDRGVVFLDDGVKWVRINSSKKFENQTMASFEIKIDGSVEGTITERGKNYGAYYKRTSFVKLGGEDKYLEELKSEHPSWEIDDFQLTGIKELDKPVDEKYKVLIEDFCDPDEDKIFFNPLLVGQWEENPFVNKERKYPVDFTQEINRNLFLSLKIPEGFEVEDLPKSLNMSLPDKAGNFTYIIKQLGNNIQIRQMYSLNKTLFLPEEYSELKSFHDKIMELTQQQVVLKKVI